MSTNYQFIKVLFRFSVIHWIFYHHHNIVILEKQKEKKTRPTLLKKIPRTIWNNRDITFQEFNSRITNKREKEKDRQRITTRKKAIKEKKLLEVWNQWTTHTKK